MRSLCGGAVLLAVIVAAAWWMVVPEPSSGDERAPLLGALPIAAIEPGPGAPITAGPGRIERVEAPEPPAVDAVVATADAGAAASGDVHGLVEHTGPFTCTGRIVDEAGEPVAGATVRLVDHELFDEEGVGLVDEPYRATCRSGTEVRTDESGAFLLGGLAPGWITLVLEAPGRMTVSLDVPAERDAAASIGTVCLPTGGRIAGRVVDGHGAPVAGAEVLLSRLPPEAGARARAPGDAAPFLAQLWRETQDRAVTGTDGRFVAAGLPFTLCCVVIDHPDHQPTVAHDIPSGDAEQRFVLGRAARIELRAVAPGGPVPLTDGIEVEAFQLWQPGGDRVVDLRAEPCADGSLVLHRVGPSANALRLVVPGHAVLERELPGVPPGGVARVELMLAPEARVAGRLVGPDGAPVAGAVVEVRRRGGEWHEPHAVTSSVDGSFAVGHLDPGAWWLKAEADGLAPALVPDLLLAEGEHRELDLHMVRGARVAGREVDASRTDDEGRSFAYFGAASGRAPRRRRGRAVCA